MLSIDFAYVGNDIKKLKKMLDKGFSQLYI
jgi:hypothetical protein